MNDPVSPLNPTQTEHQETQAAKEGYISHVLVGLDQFANTLTGGQPDETISSRAARDAEKGDKPAEVLSEVLDLFQKNHGSKAVAGDEERALTVEKTEEDSGLIS